MPRSPAAEPKEGLAYSVLVVSLIVFGFVAIFTIGRAFWLVAAAMIVLVPFRSRPRVWRSGMALVVGCLIGFAVFAPVRCTHTATFDPVVGVDPTVCRSLSGIEYTGPDEYTPPIAPALITGIALGVLMAGATWLLVGRHQERGSDLDARTREGGA